MSVSVKSIRFVFAILLSASGIVGVSQGTAAASPVLFATHGVFDDGGSFSGTFVFDPQQTPPLSFAGPFNIITTPGSLFGGFNYVGAQNAGDAQTTPCGVIQFSFAVLNQSQLVIAVPGSSFATFGGGPIVNTCPGSGTIAFEQLFPPTASLRTVTGGAVSPVPETGPFAPTLAVMMFCVLRFIAARIHAKRPISTRRPS